MLSNIPIQMLSAQQEEHSHQVQLLNSRPIRTVQRQNNVFYKFKLVLLGESYVGKSALAYRFAKGKFNEKFDSTIGAGFFLPTIWLEHSDGEYTKIKLEIWDTAGQERFRSITPMYIRGAKAAIVVYDISNRNSFFQAKYWVEYLRNAQLNGLDNQKVIIAFVGNKIDLAVDDEKQREVQLKEAQKYASENELIFIETSAKTSTNVYDLFETLSKVLLRIEKEKIEEKETSTTTNNGRRSREELQRIILDRVETFQGQTRQKVQNCCN